MGKYLAFFCTGLFSLSLTAQISLEIRDEHSNLPVSGARIQWIHAGDTLTSTSGSDGKAEFPQALFPAQINVIHPDYKPILNHSNQALNRIYIAPLPEELDNVVVTGQARPILASQAVRLVRVMDSERIQRQAAVNLGDLLGNELNFRVSEDAALGSQLSLQGLSGSKIKILVDGVPVIGRLDGNIDLNQINLNNIERVEVVEGPMAVQYGTDAVAGTINLITKKKAVDKFEGTLNSYVESVGRYNVDFTARISPDDWQTAITLGRNYFGGYDRNPDSRDLMWNPKEQRFIQASVLKRVGKTLWRYRFDGFDENITNRGAVGSLDSLIVPVDTGAWKYPRALDDYYATARINNAVHVDYYPNDKVKVIAFLAYNYYRREKNTRIKNLSTGNETFFGGEDAQDTTTFGTVASRMMIQHDLLPKKLSYMGGYDFNYEENTGNRILGEYRDITELALFLTADYSPFESVLLQPGLRYAYNNRFQAPVIASLATRFQLNEQFVLRLSYGQGFRAPTLKELYFIFVDENHNILGNTHLLAERSDNYQMNLSYLRTYERATVEADVNAFWNDISNEIRLVAIADPGNNDPRGLYQNQNIARTRTNGGGTNVKLNIGNWKIESGFALIGVKNNLSFETGESDGRPLDYRYSTQTKFNVSYLWNKYDLQISILLNHNGARNDWVINGEDALQSITFSEYTLSDFTVRKGFLSNKLNWTIGVKNLFDFTEMTTSEVVSTGAHSAGTGRIPLSYGRTIFTQLQWAF